MARWQLLKRGFTRRWIAHRVERGRLHVIHRGVYAVGHAAVSADGRRMAAVLAGGPGAVLSHRDAGAAYGIFSSQSGPVDVTAPQRLGGRPGIAFHRAQLPADEVSELRGIPITTPARTIFDLAAREPRRRVEGAMHEADVRRLWDVVPVPALLDRYPRARGTAVLRAILADRGAGDSITRAELEDLFADFCEEYGLPRPLTNHWIAKGGRSFECDCVWPERRLIVELDGYATHSTRRKFESDRERDRLLAPEWLVVRVTWRQLRYAPDAVAADLQRLLARSLAA